MIKTKQIQFDNGNDSIVLLRIFDAIPKKDMFSKSGMKCYNKGEVTELYYHPFDGRIAIYRRFHTPKTPNGNSYKLYKNENEILEDFEPC